MTTDYKTIMRAAHDSYGIDMGDPHSLADYELFGERHTRFALVIAHTLCVIREAFAHKH